MPLKVTQVDSVPPLVRGGAAKNSEENQQIQNLLNMKNVHHKVEDIDDKKTYQSLQQRIRTQAKKLGVKVSIQWKEDQKAIYFTSTDLESTNGTQETVQVENLAETATAKGSKTSAKK